MRKFFNKKPILGYLDKALSGTFFSWREIFGLMILSCVIFTPLLPFLLNRFHPTDGAFAMARQLLLWSIPAMILFSPMSKTLFSFVVTFFFSETLMYR